MDVGGRQETTATVFKTIGPHGVMEGTAHQMSQTPWDVVVLDGPNAPPAWSLALAESLLADPTPWGSPAGALIKDRYQDAHRLATCVNMCHRLESGMKWHNPIHDAELADHLEQYTTQELLDGLF